MSVCDHEDLGTDWLPTLDRKSLAEHLRRAELDAPFEYRDLKEHLYCRKCGTVKFSGSFKGKKLGHFTNLLPDLKRMGLKRFQKRLITKELLSNEIFSDVFGTNYLAQLGRFVEIVTKYSHLKEGDILTVI